MISRYRILFQAALLHDYFKDGKCGSFDIHPSDPTRRLLADSRLLFKVVGNTFLVLAKVDETGKPASAIPAEGKLVFHLDLKSTDFLTVTNVDASALRTRRLYFTNLNQNLVGLPPAEVFNLTRIIEAFSAARTYKPGELVRIGTAIFECIKAGLNQAPNAPNSAFWVPRGTTQYASTQDLLQLSARLANFTLQVAASAFQVKVFGLNPATNVHDNLVLEKVVTASILETTKDVQVDLGTLPPGRYRLDINGEAFEAYFDDEAAAKGVFGVVEIFLHLPDTNPFSLLNTSGVVRETPFTIRFANRRAFWKYVTPLRKVDNILLTSDHTQPSPFTAGSNDPAQPAQKDFFVSNLPLLLSEVPAQNLFDLMIGSEARPAPKPDPNIPGILTQAFDGASQTYLDSFCTIRLNH